jgi:hypothetical protein
MMLATHRVPASLPDMCVYVFCREDLIQALLTSCHIPWYFDGSIVRSFRQTPCFDGGEGVGRGGRFGEGP